jgi:hypothetical protein
MEGVEGVEAGWMPWLATKIGQPPFNSMAQWSG